MGAFRASFLPDPGEQEGHPEKDQALCVPAQADQGQDKTQGGGVSLADLNAQSLTLEARGFGSMGLHLHVHVHLHVHLQLHLHLHLHLHLQAHKKYIYSHIYKHIYKYIDIYMSL